MDLASGAIKDVVKGIKCVHILQWLASVYLRQLGTVSNLLSSKRISKNMGDMWTDDSREVSSLEEDAIRMVAAAGWA